MLSEIIDLSKYPRTTIEIIFEVMEYNCDLMTTLSNISCVLLVKSSIVIIDYFSAVYCVKLKD